jgi:DNA-binding XRE family transcriptional regulator
MPVYFVQVGDAGPVKIGTTADVRARVQFLQCGSPEPLRLLGVVDGDLFEERRLHRLLAAYRLRGEWFRPEPAVLDAAEAGRDAGAAIGLPCPVQGGGASPSDTDTFAVTLCARTKALRERAGLLQREIADLLGVPLENWKKYERRSPLPHHLVSAFCDLCRVSADDFFRVDPSSEVTAADAEAA